MAGEMIVLQEAPFPTELAKIVELLEYRPGWEFTLEFQDRDFAKDDTKRQHVIGRGLTFVVKTLGYNSYHPDRGQTYSVYHYFIVPAATYNRNGWLKWVLDQIIKVETHEACEFFTVAGDKVFAPHHGPGEDPYTIFIHGTDEERRTNFRGEMNA